MTTPGRTNRDIDPRLARFLAAHAVTVQEEVEADIARYRGMSPEDCWAETVSLARTAAWLLSLQPDPAKVVALRDPPHPSYEGVVRRLRAGWRNER